MKLRITPLMATGLLGLLASHLRTECSAPDAPELLEAFVGHTRVVNDWPRCARPIWEVDLPDNLTVLRRLVSECGLVVAATGSGRWHLQHGRLPHQAAGLRRFLCRLEAALARNPELPAEDILRYARLAHTRKAVMENPAFGIISLAYPEGL